MEKGGVAQLLCRVRFPSQTQRPKASCWIPLRRCLSLSFLGPSNGLAVHLRWFRSLLGLDRRPLQREVPVEEVNPMGQLSLHACQVLFRPVCVFSPLVCA